MFKRNVQIYGRKVIKTESGDVFWTDSQERSKPVHYEKLLWIGDDHSQNQCTSGISCLFRAIVAQDIRHIPFNDCICEGCGLLRVDLTLAEVLQMTMRIDEWSTASVGDVNRPSVY